MTCLKHITVRELKQLIQKDFLVPPDRQQLVYNGNPENNPNERLYSIFGPEVHSNECIIYLIRETLEVLSVNEASPLDSFQSRLFSILFRPLLDTLSNEVLTLARLLERFILHPFDRVCNHLQPFFGEMHIRFLTVCTVLCNFIRAIITPAANLLSTLVDVTSKEITRVWSALLSTLSSTSSWIGEALTTVYLTTIQPIVNGLRSLFATVHHSFLRPLWEGYCSIVIWFVEDVCLASLRRISRMSSTLIQRGWDVLTRVFSELGRVGSLTFTWLRAGVEEILHRLWYAMGAVGEKLMYIPRQCTRMTMPIIRGMNGFFLRVCQSMMRVCRGVWESVFHVIERTIRYVARGTIRLVHNVLDCLDHYILSSIRSALLSTRSGVVHYAAIGYRGLGRVLSSLRSIVVSITSAISRLVKSLSQSVGNGFVTIYTPTVSLLRSATYWTIDTGKRLGSLVWRHACTAGNMVWRQTCAVGDFICWLDRDYIYPASLLLLRGINCVKDGTANYLLRPAYNTITSTTTTMGRYIVRGTRWAAQSLLSNAERAANMLSWMGGYGYRWIVNPLMWPVRLLSRACSNYILFPLASFGGRCWSWLRHSYLVRYLITFYRTLHPAPGLDVTRRCLKFSLAIDHGEIVNAQPKREERNIISREGVVRMYDKQIYKIRLGCDYTAAAKEVPHASLPMVTTVCTLLVDGVKVGLFRVDPGREYVIERPVDLPKKFQFVAQEEECEGEGRSENEVTPITGGVEVGENRSTVEARFTVTEKSLQQIESVIEQLQGYRTRTSLHRNTRYSVRKGKSATQESSSVLYKLGDVDKVVEEDVNEDDVEVEETEQAFEQVETLISGRTVFSEESHQNFTESKLELRGKQLTTIARLHMKAMKTKEVRMSKKTGKTIEETAVISRLKQKAE